MTTTLLAALLAAALAAPGATPPAGPAEPVEDKDLTAAVRDFPLTLPKVMNYARAVQELREAAASDAAVAQPFLSQARFASIAESARRVEAVPKVKAILSRHGLSGRDFVLVPTVLLAARATVLAERAGQAPPSPGRDTPAVAVWREHGEGLEPVIAGFMADLRALSLPRRTQR